MSKKLWLIYLSVVCLGLLWGAFYSAGPDTRTAYYAGFYLLPAVIVTLVCHRIFATDLKTKFKTSLFFSVYGSFVAGSLISLQIQHSQEVAGFEYILDQADSLMDVSNQITPDGSPVLIDETFAKSASASGSMAVMQQFMADYLNRLAAFRNNYVVELDATGYNSILDPNRLFDDRSFGESEKLLKMPDLWCRNTGRVQTRL